MLVRRENIIIQKTESFSDRIIKMCKYLSNKKEGNAELIRQVVRSGTSIGANVAESRFAQSEADFLTKLTIALKEANETRFWINRLHSGQYLSDKEYQSILTDNEEIISILVKITNTMKRKLKK
ncbi:MAG: four helix bundle protein [Prevotella sp.]|nr:four helix bundle protein [Prevotella sp.]